MIASRNASCCAGVSLLGSKPPVSAFVFSPAADGAAELGDGDGSVVCALVAAVAAIQSISATTTAAQAILVAWSVAIAIYVSNGAGKACQNSASGTRAGTCRTASRA